MDLQRNDLAQAINSEVSNLREMAKLILGHANETEAQALLDSIRQTLKSYENAAAELDSQKSLYRRVKEHLDDTPEADNLKKIIKEQTEPVPDSSSYGFLSSFNEFVEQLISEKNQDESIVMTGQAQSSEILDPWSKLVIQTPVTCVECGHKYEKKSVESLLKKKSHFKCPYIGCDSYVTSSNIQDG